METTIICEWKFLILWGYIGIMEKKMEALLKVEDLGLRV